MGIFNDVMHSIMCEATGSSVYVCHSICGQRSPFRGHLCCVSCYQVRKMQKECSHCSVINSNHMCIMPVILSTIALGIVLAIPWYCLADYRQQCCGRWEMLAGGLSTPMWLVPVLSCACLTRWQQYRILNNLLANMARNHLRVCVYVCVFRLQLVKPSEDTHEDSRHSSEGTTHTDTHTRTMSSTYCLLDLFNTVYPSL